MTLKQVSIGGKPTKPASSAADAWVEARTHDAPEPIEPLKRLTIDVPARLHRAIKMQCASRGTKIADEVRDLLMQKYGES